MKERSFAEDVREGLRSEPKYLRSKYFYDAKGDELFQRIMELEEYYPTRAEDAILRDQGKGILEEMLPEDGATLSIVEFGAGDASKTRHLLHAVPQNERGRVRYVPNDISPHVLETLQQRLGKELPDFRIDPLAGDQSRLLKDWERRVEERQAFLFLGGNIGNYDDATAVALLQSFASAMGEGDRLLIGFDLMKDPRRIVRAYNDDQGVTRDFNLNLLERMNRELGAGFDVNTFVHFPLFDPVACESRSYLLSTREQEVAIEALDESFHFDAWEPIFMERSRKFTLTDIERLAERTGFRVQKHFSDSDGDFVDALWVKP